ncbi:MAG: hypothetical protein AUJ92_22270 [Armatimonadetes bacterium CG2_30_59_28]|nr:SDR family NAD(P)-dependent oxidoreductase [Armatimonadota bacterium]OIO89132.1 MAG: hypothetical protein AUJ92_22270 [Armatimonadetes bacterium CG2_30_59_28]
MSKLGDKSDQLVELSDLYGRDADFVIAGGGNTSVKVGDRLLIKASGIPLAGITRDGFVELDRRKVRATLTTDYSKDLIEREAQVKSDLLAARVAPEKGTRPSVEAALHELMEYSYVVHVHATIVNGMTCGENGRRVARELFGDDALWIDYCNPGYALAMNAVAAIENYLAGHQGKCPKVLFLENHGVVVGADQPREIGRLITQIVGRLSKYVAERLPENPFGLPTVQLAESGRLAERANQVAPALRGMLTTNGRAPVITFSDAAVVCEFVSSELGRKIVKAGPFTPDQIVYCRSFPLWVGHSRLSKGSVVDALRDAIAHYQERLGGLPRVILVEGLGLFSVGDTKPMAATASAAYVDVMKVARFSTAFGGPHALTSREWRFVDGWEVERYRRKVATAAAAGRRGRLDGKTAVVTGAAQGFGEGIARGLAQEGATVVIADLNEAKAAEVAQEITQQYGKGSALFVKVDVTDEPSVSEMVNAVVREYGGIDILISNAGVLKADSVKTFPLKDFEFVTRVNYTGYFLCVKHVCPVMATQHEADADYSADIIQINSKSGLRGSNKNAAYAGSKFGSIGLTQSFALELVGDGIKVNSICPGNFFDGPLWSDSDRGLFVQYLRAGKVPGAQSIEDVKKSYESKVPMRRGCRVEDVVRAILYVVEQRYETGQAIPVTGGQVMR